MPAPPTKVSDSISPLIVSLPASPRSSGAPSDVEVGFALLAALKFLEGDWLGARRVGNRVPARAASEGVVAGAAIKRVVAGLAVDFVVALPAAQTVVPVLAIHRAAK